MYPSLLASGIHPSPFHGSPVGVGIQTEQRCCNDPHDHNQGMNARSAKWLPQTRYEPEQPNHVLAKSDGALSAARKRRARVGQNVVDRLSLEGRMRDVKAPATSEAGRGAPGLPIVLADGVIDRQPASALEEDREEEQAQQQ